jgi:hypothetical protein
LVIFCSILFNYLKQTTEIGPETMKIRRLLAALALATFAFAPVQSVMAQFYGERGATASGTHSSALRGQERTIPARPFQGRAEYPPPGYLAEFEENRGERATRAERELPGEFAPLSPGSVPNNTSRNLPGPEFAPGGYNLQAPVPRSGAREYASPGEQRWASPTGAPMHEPSWSHTPSTNYQTRPEFASENLEPGRHESAPGPRGGAPAYPPRNPGWPY